MPRFVARRLMQSVLTMLVIISLLFVLLHSAPGDVVDVLAGEAGAATPEYLAQLRQQLGLDQPLIVQFYKYALNILSFDLGVSLRTNQPVFQLILERLPPTLLLLGISITTAVGAGILLGVTAARNVNRPIDNVISLAALLFYATPIFWIALMMIVLFSVQLGWFPTGGMITLGARLSTWERILDVARHAVMPSAALSLFYVAIYTRLMRASMLEVQNSDYVRTAQAKGLSDGSVAWRHVFRNALLPIVTMVGLQVGSIIGGAVLIETVFAWPGLGRLASEAIFQRDFNLLMGVLVMSCVLVLVMNIVVDIVYALVDPRITLS
ncbi:ABC transporter permease [Bosea sp. MMO-172]|uniref:ABC transporter permease n=1 Tax=Bosea sp. MMO-172 TaxID=3127885 RepID=UPI003019EC74